MGGSKATLFRYFPTKDDLLEAVVLQIVSRWQDSVHPETISAIEPRSWLLSFGALTLQWLLSEERIFVGRLVIIDGKRFPNLRKMWLQHASGPIHAAIVNKLTHWKAIGAIASPNPDRDAQCYTNLVFTGAVSNVYYGAPPLSPSALSTHVESSVDFFMRAIESSRG